MVGQAAYLEDNMFQVGLSGNGNPQSKNDQEEKGVNVEAKFLSKTCKFVLLRCWNRVTERQLGFEVYDCGSGEFVKVS
jgi:hypothetical protein